MKRVFPAVSAVLGILGMFMTLGAAGASDCGEMPFGESAAFVCIGAALVAVSVCIHKKIAACGGTQTTTRKK